MASFAMTSMYMNRKCYCVSEYDISPSHPGESSVQILPSISVLYFVFIRVRTIRVNLNVNVIFREDYREIYTYYSIIISIDYT